MTDDTQHLRWQILPDEEVTRREDDAFGVHSAYARLLLRVARDCPAPFSIGLYSSWGTGKTSIVRLLQELVKQDNSSPINVVYLDVWKYSSDPLKRWILFETERQLTGQKLLAGYRYEGRTLQSHLEFEEQLEEKGRIKIDSKSLLTLIFAAAILVGASFVAWFLVPESWKSREIIRWLFALVAGSGAVALVLGAVFKKFAEELSALVFRRSIKQVTAKPAFSSEKFGQIFHDIVSRCTENEPKRRLIFVFDNLDRCAADVAVEVISVVKTFLDEPGCVYIIPCDEQAILTHIKSNFLQSPGSEQSDTYANQFLSKFFQMTLRLPPAADFAVEDYLDKELQAAKMDDLTTDARDVLVLGYRGETPRQIKRMLNDLIAYRGIAEQIEAEGLVGENVLTSDLGHLTKMAVLSVKWPSFVRELADDPEKWAEVMEWVRAQRGGEMVGVQPDLAQFLWNTRLISPDADIRPWLYLTRGHIEKDASLTRRVEQILQNGSWPQFVELLGDKGTGDKKQQILQIASATLRRWLTSDRRLFLRNGGPVMLKAAVEFPENGALKKIALEVLDYLAGNASAAEMEQLFDVKDILSITKDSFPWQKSKVLGKFAELFEGKYPMTPDRQNICEQLIQNGEALENREKQLIADALLNRYSQSKGESEVLGLLRYAAEEPDKRQWSVAPRLVSVIDAGITFDDSEVDQIRQRIIASFKHLQSPQDQTELLSKITRLTDVARTSQPDVGARSAIKLLERLEPESLRREEIDPIVANLQAQAKRSPVPERAFWLEALANLYPVLTAVRLGPMSELFKSSFSDSDPTVAAKLSQSLSEATRKRLLEIEGFRVVLHGQAANYQGRFGGGSAEHRGRYLQTFRPEDLLNHSDIFDESLSWDLAEFIKAADRARESGTLSPEDIGSRLEAFCKSYLPEKVGTQQELYRALVEILEQHAEVVNIALARIVTTCEFGKIISGDLSAYDRYMKYKKMLPTEARNAFATELSKSLSPKAGTWVRLLLLLVDDVTTDEDVSTHAAVVGVLADFSFAAARDKWTESGDVLGKIVAFLEPREQQEYVDRALEVLLGHSAGAEDLPKMEPFLRLVGQHPNQVQGSLAAKAATVI